MLYHTPCFPPLFCEISFLGTQLFFQFWCPNFLFTTPALLPSCRALELRKSFFVLSALWQNPSSYAPPTFHQMPCISLIRNRSNWASWRLFFLSSSHPKLRSVDPFNYFFVQLLNAPTMFHPHYLDIGPAFCIVTNVSGPLQGPHLEIFYSHFKLFPKDFW